LFRRSIGQFNDIRDIALKRITDLYIGVERVNILGVITLRRQQDDFSFVLVQMVPFDSRCTLFVNYSAMNDRASCFIATTYQRERVP